MKTPNSKFKENILIATYSLFLAFLLINFVKIISILGGLVSIIKPFIIGLGIAFVINLLVKIYEKKLIPILDKKNKLTKSRRGISLVLALITLITLIWLLLVFVIPQLIDSMKILIESIPGYMKSLEDLVMPYVNETEFLASILENIIVAWKDILQIAGQFIGQSISGIVNTTFSITSGVFTTIISFVIAMYMIISKEELILGVKKVTYVLFGEKKANKIITIGRLTNSTFSKFIGGQCIEAIIVGILCFIGMLILKMPYPLLISVIIGVTNMLPIFGPFIGTIPSAFILLMVDPSKALWFVVFIVVLQQIESNLIYPRVVGSSIGLSAIWVLFAITVGGELFGLVGMLLGVPTVAVIYSLVKDSITNKLKEKKITIK